MASSLRILATVGLLALGLLAGCGDGGDGGGDGGTETEKPHFSYSGETGPSHWGELDPSFAECSDGDAQSPIDLTKGRASEEPALDVSYEPAKAELENNGHSVEAFYSEGSSISLGGTEYDLDRFHFHAPAEHEIDGRTFPLEFHFVNEGEDGAAAVLGVMVTEGAENPAFSELIAALPQQDGETAVVEDVNASELLPADPASVPRWSYDGSLTTPPCTEGVKWAVFDEPIELSAEQIASYEAVYDDNNRPLQELNGRELLLAGGP